MDKLMDRRKVLERIVQRGNLLNLRNKFYAEFIDRKIIPLIEEDFSNGDITTELAFKNNPIATAQIIAKQNGIISGIEEAKYILGKFSVSAVESISEGKSVKSGEQILKIECPLKSILKTERMILNMIGRMSGISTMAYNLRKIVEDKIGIACTRKSLLLYTDKKAVFVGGGLTHRLNLSDGVLLKDNHLSVMKNERAGFRDAFERIVSRGIESIFAEAENSEQASSILDTFEIVRKKFKKEVYLVIMFDNMMPEEIKKMVAVLRKKTEFPDNIFFEASGNITEKSIKEYAGTGVDYVSLGILNHSVKNFDLCMRIK